MRFKNLAILESGLQIPLGAAAGRVLSSDGSGNGSWIAAPASAPNGPASGDLTGTYPSPTVALLAITDSKVALANKNGADTTVSMRTLGYGAGEAMPGLPLTAVPFNAKRLTGVADPTAAQDAVTKVYVDRTATRAFAMAVS